MTDRLLMQQPGIAEIKWNFTGAFIGCTTDVTPSTQNNTSLNFSMFLAAPLLNIKIQIKNENFPEMKKLQKIQILLVV